jgi:hypothetical protein
VIAEIIEAAAASTPKEGRKARLHQGVGHCLSRPSIAALGPQNSPGTDHTNIATADTKPERGGEESPGETVGGSLPIKASNCCSRSSCTSSRSVILLPLVLLVRCAVACCAERPGMCKTLCSYSTQQQQQEQQWCNSAWQQFGVWGVALLQGFKPVPCKESRRIWKPSHPTHARMNTLHPVHTHSVTTFHPTPASDLQRHNILGCLDP